MLVRCFGLGRGWVGTGGFGRVLFAGQGCSVGSFVGSLGRSLDFPKCFPGNSVGSFEGSFPSSFTGSFVSSFPGSFPGNSVSSFGGSFPGN